METIIGIDLGTTNSEVAVIRDGQPDVLMEDGDPILPSFVGLSEDGRLLVGRAARNQWLVAPERTIKSIKRKMGQDVKVRLGDQEYRPQEISAMILRKLRDRAAAQLGEEVKKAVITVPAYFNDSQRQATREAGSLAGLEVVRILNEPTAASLTYDPSHRELSRMLVYDLGGGTFDVSIVQAQDGVVEVLSSHGDTQLGGDDFDELLLHLICDRFKQEHDIDLRADLLARSRVLQAAENAKKHLSFHPFARIEEEFIAEKDGKPLHLSMEISRGEYESLIRPLILRTMDCVQRALTDAKLSSSQIDKVVLVGGSTRTPLISQLLEERLGQPAHQEINPDLCVAMGAAIEAGVIAGMNVGAVLVDIATHSLGIRCVGNGPMGTEFFHHFAPIIRRNTPLPTSQSEVFYTYSDNQQTVKIEVYQGEDSDVRNNHHVGEFLIEGLSRVPAGNPLLVQLNLSLDGVLEVSAKERATGLEKKIRIDNALARFQRTEKSLAQDRLDRLWADEGDEAEESFEQGVETPDSAVPLADQPLPELAPGPRDGHRETVQARALIEKAERLKAKAPAEDQAELQVLINRVEKALSERKWAEVTRASNDLADTLFYLEDA